MGGDIDDSGLLAVMAHSLLGTVTSISGSVKTLRAHPALGPDQRDELLAIIDEQADHLAAVLLDLVRTGSQATRRALDELATPRPPEPD